MRSDDCASGLHDYCSPCDCECHSVLGQTQPDWRNAALRIGEELANNGPNNYYRFTPEEWLNWVMEQIKRLKEEGRTDDH